MNNRVEIQGLKMCVCGFRRKGKGSRNRGRGKGEQWNITQGEGNGPRGRYIHKGYLQLLESPSSIRACDSSC